MSKNENPIEIISEEEKQEVLKDNPFIDLSFKEQLVLIEELYNGNEDKCI